MNARTEALDGDLDRIRREHALLIESIEFTPVAVAVYDDHDRLIFWNKPYERVHASAFAKLRGKADRRELYYGDLVRVIAEATMAADLVEGYVRRRVQEQRDADGVGVDRNYPGVGWFRISKFKTRSGAIAGFALDINENKHYEARLENEINRREALEERLRLQANTDALTQLANRGALLERAEMEFLRGDRFGDYLSMIMMDVDFFKKVNDTYGHGVGDMVLVSLARATGRRFAQVSTWSAGSGGKSSRCSSCTPRSRTLLLVRRRFDRASKRLCFTALMDHSASPRVSA
jgi:hypothetical protein